MPRPSTPQNAPRSAVQISRLIQQRIETGVLGPGDKLLSSRALAAELGVSRTTVMAAFNRLRLAGLIEMRQGAPVRVCRDLPPAAARNTAQGQAEPPPRLSAFGMSLSIAAPHHAQRPTPEFDFRPGLGDADLFAISDWRRALARADQTPADPAGLSRAVQAYLKRTRHIDCPADQIIVLPQIAQARDLCLRIMARPGAAVIVEDPSPPQMRELLSAHEMNVIPTRSGAGGLETGMLSETAARLACVRAAHQYPLGGVLSAEHRHALQSWAMQNDAYILDEEGEGPYRYDGAVAAPLFSPAPQARALHLGAFGHILHSVSGLCYLLVPPVLAPAFTAAQDLLGARISGIEQTALTKLLSTQVIDRHIRRLRRRFAPRRAALISALSRLKSVRIHAEPAGLHLVAWLEDVPASQEQLFCHLARGAGVGLTPLSTCEGAGPRRDRPAAVLMGFARMDPVRIELGVTRLEKQLRAFRS